MENIIIESETDYINLFDQYTEYSKIESHLEFSKRMFLLDKKGKHILSQLDKKKYEYKKKNGRSIFKSNISIFYINLVNILNVRQFIPRLYFTLQYYMDELLFKEVKKQSKFYIEDDEYDLTRLYSDQISWLKNQDIQLYKLEISDIFDINEAMCLVCYLREYEDLLFSINEYIIDLDDKYLKKNIIRTITRIRYKLKIKWDITINIINITLKNDSKKN